MTTPWSDRVEKLEREWLAWGHKYFRKLITDIIIDLYNGEPILDVGCGAGVLYNQLPSYIKKNYTGVDFTPEFIELCRKRYPKGNWRIEDIFNLSFKDKTYNIINTTNVLQHIHKGNWNIDDWKMGAKELIRVSNKYIINCVRVHDKPTTIIPMEPRSVLHRYFNPQDLLDFYLNYGKTSWFRVKDSRGKPILGVFMTEIS